MITIIQSDSKPVPDHSIILGVYEEDDHIMFDPLADYQAPFKLHSNNLSKYRYYNI